MDIISRGLIIDGQERPAASGLSFETPNPATGATLAHLARGGLGDVDAAVTSAHKAFGGAWAKINASDRSRILMKAGELILARVEELAQLETADTGKPLANSRAIDVPLAADTFFYFSGWPTKLLGDTIPVKGPFLNYTLREPLGVVGAIIPWNFPILMAARKVAAALAAGNCVILKPAEEASLTSLELGKILLDAGLPAGVFNVITGLGEEAGAAMVDHPGIAKISFTGGTDTGRIIMRNAANTLKKLSLELGGKSPNIIFADADVDAAAKAATRAVFYNMGEICTAGSRLLVEKKVHDRVVEELVSGARKLVPGDPTDPAIQMGPLVSEVHKNRVSGFISRGEEEGATRLTGGPVERPGFFVAPTVFTDVQNHMTIAREEIFGPVLSIIPFETVDEAATIANDNQYGLAAGVWTRDIGKAHSMAARLRAGTVWINTYNNFDSASPYGGYKQSGFGRLNGKEVMDEMTQVKSVWVNLK